MGSLEASELNLGSNPASVWANPFKPFCVIEIVCRPHRIRSDVGLPKSCGFYAHSHFYQMMDVECLCRLEWEEGDGTKRVEYKGSGNLAPETQLWFDAKSLDAARGWGTQVVVLSWPWLPSMTLCRFPLLSIVSVKWATRLDKIWQPFQLWHCQFLDWGGNWQLVLEPLKILFKRVKWQPPSWNWLVGFVGSCGYSNFN